MGLKKQIKNIEKFLQEKINNEIYFYDYYKSIKGIVLIYKIDFITIYYNLNNSKTNVNHNNITYNFSNLEESLTLINNLYNLPY